MAEWCRQYGADIRAFCLMPNQIHLAAVLEEKYSLYLAIGEAHRRYTRAINFREGRRGHLWQRLFASKEIRRNHLNHSLNCVNLVSSFQLIVFYGDRADEYL